MTFQSILNISSHGGPQAEAAEAPAYFVDLNLDQIVAAITAGKQEYKLLPFFYAPLKSREAIEYRQGVMRDLENKAHFDAVTVFASIMKSVRDHIAQSEKLYYKYQKEAWLLNSVDLYCGGVKDLHSHFSGAAPASEGLLDFFKYLDTYVGSTVFQQLLDEITALKAKFAAIRYTLIVRSSVVTVSTYNDEPDYGAEIQRDFENFKQDAASDHIFKFNDFVQMNHIEAGVLDRVARLYPEAFSELDAFAERNFGFFDPTVRQFDREIQFYVAYIAYMNHIRGAGVTFCYPIVSEFNKAIRVIGSYDVALAKLLITNHQTVVTNDFFLEGRERIIIVSGPNQGGKTTFVRMFGQLHYLASIGCRVPAAEAQLVAFDQLFTHFEKREDIHNLRGKLHDDLFRLRNTLTKATSNSIIILNEVFNSTSLNDAIFLSTKVLTKIIELDAICVCVTFIDELVALSNTAVSMASNVNPDNFAERTFKIVRRPPDGLAYAISIAEKYRLSYAQLRDRLAP